MRLENIASVQERHLSILLDPNLIPRVGSDYGKRRDVQSEFSSLGVLAQADTEGEEIVALDGGSEVRERFSHIVNARALGIGQLLDFPTQA